MPKDADPLTQYYKATFGGQTELLLVIKAHPPLTEGM